MTGCAMGMGGPLTLCKVPEETSAIGIQGLYKPFMSILKVESYFKTTKKGPLFIFLEREIVIKGERK